MHYPCQIKETPKFTWIGIFPDFPTLIIEGASPSEVKQLCKERLSALLHMLLLAKEPIPQPSNPRLGQQLISVPDALAVKIENLP